MNDAPEQVARPLIIQYWHAQDLPQDIGELCASFDALNPKMRHCIFSESTAERFIEKHLGQRELAAFQACAVPAMQADYFRYCALYAIGGMYFDADCRCLRSLDPLAGPDHAELFRNKGTNTIGNGALIFMRAGHPLLKLVLELATVNIEHRVHEDVVSTTGPRVFRVFIEMQRLGSMDAFVDRVTTMVPRWKAIMACDIAGDYETVIDALSRVRLSPRARIEEFVEHENAHLAYRQLSEHYGNYKGSIYR